MTQTILLLHLLATAVLIGNLLASAVAARTADLPEGLFEGDRLERLVLDRSRWVPWACLAVLLLTGLLMLYKWHVGPQQAISGAFYESRFGRLLVIKLVGTALLAMGLLSSRSATKRFARLNLLLGLFLILISVHIVR
jgi:uncharacterized membrane protein